MLLITNFFRDVWKVKFSHSVSEIKIFILKNHSYQKQFI